MLEPAANPVVLITGAGAGIGLATARRFARAGWRVLGWDLGFAADLAADLEALGGEGWLEEVDVRDRARVEAAVEELGQRWGRLDAVIANAGIVRDAQLVKWRGGGVAGGLAEADFDAVLDVNLGGVFRTVQAAVPWLIKSGGGSIVVASSVVAHHGNFGQTNYAATKAGVLAMMRTWARELGRYRIRVNAIAPGFVDTAMARSVPEPLLARIVEHTPLGRLGEPAEVAEAYYWLSSSAASFITGAVLNVDGGLVVGT